jgi:ribosomal protein S18 acetylase RimI-like enzyme
MRQVDESSLDPVSAEIRRASSDDVVRLARPLAFAFFDDPVFSWIAPDEGRRRQMLTPFFELFAEMLVVQDESYLVGDFAAALWAAPDKPPVAEEEAGAFGERLDEIGGSDAERLLTVATLIDDHHPAGTYYYLQFLGVVPERQGQGIGSAMLSLVLERSEREGVAAFLDATSSRNRALYERHGFRTTNELRIARGPTLWQMYREPHPTGT